MADAPNSYSDPYWTQLSSATEQKLGLPAGLLSSVVTNGERSNADQVSSAGARTPFQVTPQTRNLVLQRDGIDAYLSPQNAAEVAGTVLKDGMNWARSQTNDAAQIPALAAGYYHAGGDQSNWGPKTRAYMQRVAAGLPQSGADGAPQDGSLQPSVAGFSGPSTFDRAQAQLQQEQNVNSQIATLYQAYSSGQMTPQQARAFESDVVGGRIMLPSGATLRSGVMGQAEPSNLVPDVLLRAFATGQMTPEQQHAFEGDVRSGTFALPNGITADGLFGAQPQRLGPIDSLKEAITGNQRATPMTKGLPDYTALPELSDGDLWPRLKVALGTMATDARETADIIKKNFPGVQLATDEKGNMLIQSGMDGQLYAIKPGFRPEDAVRAAGSAANFMAANEVVPGSGLRGLFAKVGREAVVGAVGQTAIEGQKAATGGNFDASNIPTAAAIGAVAPVVAAGARGVVAPAQSLLERLRGTSGLSPAAEAAAPATGMDAATGAGSAPSSINVDSAGTATTPAQRAAAQAPGFGTAAPQAAMPAATATAAPSVQDVAQAARAASGGSKLAMQQLADLAAPDANVTAAAKRLGIEDYLQPDHVTSSDAYRQVLGVLKSNPTGQLALTEKEGLANLGQRASNLIDEVGGSNDLSSVSAGLKSKMAATHADALNAENALWQKLRDTIPAKQPAPASATLDFLNQRLDDLGGDVKSLTPMERDIMARVSPQQVPVKTTTPGNPLMPGAMRPTTSTTMQEVQPTYARVDDIRKDVGMAARQAGPFSDADTGLAKKYYSLLTQDQEAAAGPGNVDLVQQAKAATVVRKGLEDDMTALFGKKLDQSMAPDLASGMRAAGSVTGDPSGLVRLLQATPQDMRPQVVASGLGTVFRNAATRGDISFGQFSKWWGNLQRNQTAFNAVMSNLSPEARQQISDLATVSKAIDASQQARIRTGLRSSVLDEMNAPDSLATRMFDLAKHAGKGLAADAVGGHGAGLAMGLFSALKGANKPSALKALDEVLTSPEFVQMARAAGTPGQQEAARAMAFSAPFTRFARSVGNASALSDRQRFILGALQEAPSGSGNEHAVPQRKMAAVPG